MKSIGVWIRAFAVAFVLGLAIGLANAWFQGRTGQPLFTGMVTWLIPMLGAVFTFAIAGGLAGNRKVATASADERARALAFTPVEGRAMLIAYRRGFVGKAVGVDLSLDGAVVAQLKSPRFTALDLAPGEHTVSAVAQVAGGKLAGGPLSLTASPGQVIVVAIAMKMGAFRNTLTLEQGSADEDLRRTLSSTPMVTPDAMGLF